MPSSVWGLGVGKQPLAKGIETSWMCSHLSWVPPLIQGGARGSIPPQGRELWWEKEAGGRLPGFWSKPCSHKPLSIYLSAFPSPATYRKDLTLALLWGLGSLQTNSLTGPYFWKPCPTSLLLEVWSLDHKCLTFRISGRNSGERGMVRS